MKKISTLILICAAATSLWGQQAAQPTHVQDAAESKELNTQAYIQLLRADLRSDKQQLVKEAMQLNNQQSAVFWPIYKEYDKDLAALRDIKLQIIKDYADNFMTMNDAKADAIAQKVMELDQKKLALRKEYYGKMKAVLPAVLAVRFFQIDNQIQMLIDLQIAANLPIIEEGETGK